VDSEAEFDPLNLNLVAHVARNKKSIKKKLKRTKCPAMKKA